MSPVTPGARVAAAIGVVDAIINGSAAEQALTRWSRASRFAGSKDRAAVRDLVFDTLRHWRSDAVRGGAETGRGRMIGRLRALGADLDALFDGTGYAPAPLSAAEKAAGSVPEEMGARWDMPDWLIPVLQHSLGADAERTALALTGRAPVTLRANSTKTDRDGAITALAECGITASPNPRAATAVTVTDGARRIRNTAPYQSGLVELQDAASQAAVADLTGSGRALDYCAGGGGKALALAAQGWMVTAHDAVPERMRDIPVRAARGGHDIAICERSDLDRSDPFDLVFCDAPCSGSGTWRRAPEAKWALSPERLAGLIEMQADVLRAAAAHVAPGGTLVYATCSVLGAENERQVSGFLDAHGDWRQTSSRSWPVDDLGDGFYCAYLTRWN